MKVSTPVIVSACLAGLHCRWDGRSCPHPAVTALVRQGRALPVCPEQLGGLPTPRSPASAEGGKGREVLAGKARVVDSKGNDVTAAFVAGARQVVALARLAGSREAILKQRSPSCCPSGGVTALLLAREGVEVRSEEALETTGWQQ